MKKQLFLTLVVALGFLLIRTLVINDFIYGEPVASDKPSGQFGFPYPNFTDASGAMTAQQLIEHCDW